MVNDCDTVKQRYLSGCDDMQELWRKYRKLKSRYPVHVRLEMFERPTFIVPSFDSILMSLQEVLW